MFTKAELQHWAYSEHFPFHRKIPTWNDKRPETPRPFLLKQAVTTELENQGFTMSMPQSADEALCLSLGQLVLEQKITESATMEFSSVLKKRRRRMNHHKHKKWLKRMKFRLRADGRK